MKRYRCLKTLGVRNGVPMYIENNIYEGYETIPSASSDVQTIEIPKTEHGTHHRLVFWSKYFEELPENQEVTINLII